MLFLFSSRRRHTRCALVTGVQTCALPICRGGAVPFQKALMRSPWRLEAGALTALALPMIAGNIAWAGIAATDLLLLGRLGAGAVASGALAINLFNALLIFGMGLGPAAAPLIASERGRRQLGGARCGGSVCPEGSL